MSHPNVSYQPGFYSVDKSLDLYLSLLNCPFESTELTVKGRKCTPLRKVCSYADPDIFYTYSGVTPKPHPWSNLLLEIKSDLEKHLNCQFNYVLLNYYESGRAKIGVHRDNEEGLDKDTPIATISLGATRTIAFARRGYKTVYQPLENGSLLLLKDQVWTHSIPADEDNQGDGRISLTFRRIKPTTPVMENADDRTPAKKFRPARTSTPDLLQQACAEIPESDWLTDFYSEPEILTETRDLKKFWLGPLTAVSVQVYKGDLCVHVREFYHPRNDPLQLLPSKSGVFLTLDTYFELAQKIYVFANSLCYARESTVVNNCVLALAENGHLTLRQFNASMLHPNRVVLNIGHLQTFRELVPDIESYLLEYIYCEQLKPLVSSENVPYNEEYMTTCFSDLRGLIEQNLCTPICQAYSCLGCQFNSPSQDNHPCIQLPAREKFQSVPPSVKMLVNVKAVAHEYLDSHGKITARNYDFVDLCNKLFQ